MRCTVASAGNDHRLGAQEAPPAIISLYPGQGFESFVDSVVSGGDLLGPVLKISEEQRNSQQQLLPARVIDRASCMFVCVASHCMQHLSRTARQAELLSLHGLEDLELNRIQGREEEAGDGLQLCHAHRGQRRRPQPHSPVPVLRQPL